jgi:hypothetical protein
MNIGVIGAHFHQAESVAAFYKREGVTAFL